MSQPQTPPQWYPPPQPEKKGLSTGAIVAIVAGVVIVAVIIVAVLAGAFLATVQQTSNLSRPNVAVTDAKSTYYENCGAFGSQTTRWSFSATLVNTGGAGYAQIGYDVNDQQVTANTYYVSANSELPISDGVTVSTCYGSTIPTYTIVLLSEQPA